MKYEVDLKEMVTRVVNLACMKSIMLRDPSCFNPEGIQLMKIDNVGPHIDLSSIYSEWIKNIN